MARRSNGEGSFYQQKDKSWVYQVTYGRKEDGSPYRKAFKGRTKTICKERRAQWEEEQARIVQNTPKTSTSNREIAISDGLCELLIRHLFTLANSTWPNPDGLLFPSKAGTHLDPKSFEIRLAAVSKRCEIRKVNPHALRHTLATRLVEDKVPLNIVQGILGHSSIETTRKYLHKNEDIEREAIGMMSDYLNMGQMDAAPRLNGTAPRAKFADIVLPTFPQRRNHTA